MKGGDAEGDIMKDAIVNKNRIINILQTALILGGMVAFLALLGLSVAGRYGLMLSFFLSFLMIVFYPAIKPSVIARFYGATYVSAKEAHVLYSYLEELSKRAELEKAPSIYLINTDAMAAFTIGRSKDSIIVLSRGLIDGLELPETVSVLAHEIAHILNNDLWLMSITDIISRVAAMLSLIGQILIMIYLPIFLLKESHVPWVAIAILIFSPLVISLLQLSFSRVREYDADVTSAYLTGETKNLASALQKIEYGERGLFGMVFFPAKKENSPSLFRTHPDTGERIRRLAQIELPPDIKPIKFEQHAYAKNDYQKLRNINTLLRYLLERSF